MTQGMHPWIRDDHIRGKVPLRLAVGDVGIKQDSENLSRADAGRRMKAGDKAGDVNSIITGTPPNVMFPVMRRGDGTNIPEVTGMIAEAGGSELRKDINVFHSIKFRLKYSTL